MEGVDAPGPLARRDLTVEARKLDALLAQRLLVSARISPDTADKLERYLHYLNQREPGLNVKMSTAVRMLIVRGLEQLEKEIGPLPPLPRGKR